MQVHFLVTPDIEDRLAGMGLAGTARIITIEALCSLQGGEVSRTTPADTGRQLTDGLIAGCIWGEIDPSARASAEAVARALVIPVSTRPVHFQAFDRTDRELAAWMTGRLVDLASASALESSRAVVQLGRLRTALEQSEASLRRMQDCAPFDSGTALVFQIPPDEGTRALTKQPLEQWVADCGDALHGFDLLLKSRSGLSNVTVLVDLIGSDSGRSIAAWQVLETALREGWNRFDCPPSNEPLNEPIIIRIRAAGPGGRVEVGTGDPRLSPSSHRTGPVHPLALRIWGGVLGVSAARSGIGHAPVGEKSGRAHPRVAASDVLTLAAPFKQSQAKLIRWLKDPPGLEVHPNGQVPIVAVATGLEADGVVSLRAAVTLAHPEAEATEFTLYACRSGTAPPFARRSGKRKGLWGRLRPTRDVAEPSDGLSWLLLRAGETGEVRFRAAVPLSGKVDIYFATRNIESSNHFSWAVFRSVTVEYAAEPTPVDAV